MQNTQELKKVMLSALETVRQARQKLDDFLGQSTDSDDLEPRLYENAWEIAGQLMDIELKLGVAVRQGPDATGQMKEPLTQKLPIAHESKHLSIKKVF